MNAAYHAQYRKAYRGRIRAYLDGLCHLVPVYPALARKRWLHV